MIATMPEAASRAPFFAGGDSFLLVRFREFYEEVVRWKRRVVQESRGLAGSEPEPSAAAITPPITVVESLHGLLTRQEAEVRRAGGDYAAEMYRRAQYVMAAREQLAAVPSGVERWKVLRMTANDLVALRRCDQNAARLALERAKFDEILRQQRAAEEQQRTPVKCDGLSRETIQRIEKELRLL